MHKKMNSIRKLILLYFILFSVDNFAQRIKEKDIISFRIYDYLTYPKDKHFEDYTPEDISKMTYYQVPADSLKGAVGRPRKMIVSPFYKGSSFATVDLKNGKRIKLKISLHGAFYTDLENNKIYYIRKVNRPKFENILRAASKHNDK
jgi:hypothetical protein